MKIKEQFHYDDLTGTFTEIQTHDVNPVLENVAALKSSGIIGSKDKKHVARIPSALLEVWVKEAGLRFDDHEAVRDLMLKKILSGDYPKLRPWEGTF